MISRQTCKRTVVSVSAMALNTLNDSDPTSIIRGYIYTKSCPEHRNLKVTKKYGVVSKGKKEVLKNGEVVLVISKDSTTGKYKGLVARGTNQPPTYDHKLYWPSWNGDKVLEVKHVEILTRILKIKKSRFPRLCTQSNICQDVKPKLLKYLLDREMKLRRKFL